MKASIWTSLLLLAGSCSFDTSGLLSTDGSVEPPADADPLAIDSAVVSDADETVIDSAAINDTAISDAEGVLPDAFDPLCGWSYDPTHFDPCSIPLVPTTLDLSASGTYVYDTDAATLTNPGSSVSSPPNSSSGGVRILWTNSFTVGNDATLRVVGDQPLMVVSTSDISVGGTVSVASAYRNGDYRPGAGANPEVCPASPPDPGQICAQHGGSGGGAGAFGGNGGEGGEGGDGHTCVTDGIPGGAGGVALASAPTTIRGGCAGRDGAPNHDGTGFGPGGPGGGAVQLTANGTLTVTGILHAGGAGGRPGFENRSAGGAGGSGGMLGLESDTITIAATATLAANGGGGGGGCNDGAASPGEDGKAGATVASGGAKQETGGDGGNGGFLTVPEGQPGQLAERGGGGGGGGVGFIIINAHGTLTNAPAATISPTATVL